MLNRIVSRYDRTECMFLCAFYFTPTRAFHLYIDKEECISNIVDRLIEKHVVFWGESLC